MLCYFIGFILIYCTILAHTNLSVSQTATYCNANEFDGGNTRVYQFLTMIFFPVARLSKQLDIHKKGSVYEKEGLNELAQQFSLNDESNDILQLGHYQISEENYALSHLHGSTNRKNLLGGNANETEQQDVVAMASFFDRPEIRWSCTIIYACFLFVNITYQSKYEHYLQMNLYMQASQRRD